MRININIESDINFEHLKERFNEGVEKGIARATELVGHTAKQKAPVQFGTLRRSIIPRIKSTGSGVKAIGEVIQDEKIASYGRFVEFGTGLYGPKHQRIYPKNKKALAWTIGNIGRPGSKEGAAWNALTKAGSAKVVRSIKGMHAQPYMRPALKENLENIKTIMEEEINKAINRK